MRYLSLTLNCFMFSCWWGVWAGSNSIHIFQLALGYRISWRVLSQFKEIQGLDKSMELLGYENCDCLEFLYSIPSFITKPWIHLWSVNLEFSPAFFMSWRTAELGNMSKYYSSMSDTCHECAESFLYLFPVQSALGVLTTVKEGSSRWSFA